MALLSGQWVGQSRGDPPATVVIDLDPIGDRAIGWGYLFPHDAVVPATAIRIELPDLLTDHSVDNRVDHFLSDTGDFPNLEYLSQRYPDVTFPTNATVNLVAKDSNSLELDWVTPVGTRGTGILTRVEPNRRSSLGSELAVKDWRSFQEYVTSNEMYGFIYRGQSFPWPLQTSFHRTKRRDLRRYQIEDVPRLHRALTGRTKHVFDLVKPQEYGSFLNLAQHHGFPTPTLDWTYSPFVAAYFAYASANATDIDEPIRIYAFDQAAYTRNHLQIQHLTCVRPHFSLLEALSIENERAIPQQGLLTVTNMKDIEGFIEFQERGGDDRFLYAYDLPRHERDKALSDLRLMGITQATLFPGIESICSEQRNRFF